MSQFVRLRQGPRDLSDIGLANIVEGESLLIKWPDNSQTTEVVHISGETAQARLETSTEEMPMSRVYVDTMLRGVPVRVFLSSHDQIRVRRPNV